MHGNRLIEKHFCQRTTSQLIALSQDTFFDRKLYQKYKGLLKVFRLFILGQTKISSEKKHLSGALEMFVSDTNPRADTHRIKIFLFCPRSISLKAGSEPDFSK